jgi:hypothetical protein
MSVCNWAVTQFGALALLLLVSGAENAKASALWASNGASLTPINVANGAIGSAVSINGATAGWSDLAGANGLQGALVWGIGGFLTDTPLVAMDPLTKQVASSVTITPSFTAAQTIRSLAIDPESGAFYGASPSGLYRIAPTTGAATLVGATALGVSMALGFDGAGNLYGVANQNQLVAVNKATGATSLVATLGVLRMEDIAVQPETGVMYGIGYGPDYSLYQISLTDGALVKLGPSLGRPNGLAFAAVPEPATIVLIAMGSWIVAACRRP